MATQNHNRNDTGARHAEIARRYAWQAQQKRRGENTDRPRLITLIRLRELERLFQYRYGRMLPNDDAGIDDLTVAAHHVAHLGGDIVGHIVAWARVWAPWLPADESRALAHQVAADPRKFTAGALAWRVGLSGAERTALKITTIQAVGTDPVEERKRKDRERKRAKRAANSSGRPRGRPRKMRPQQIGVIAADAFSDVMARSPADVTEAAKPPAGAVGTLSKTSEGEEVDGAAVVGNPSRKLKTRFPTAMRLSKEMSAYARSAAFEPEKICRMFEAFGLWNLAMRSYSEDWSEVWFKWVDREVDIVNEGCERKRRQAYMNSWQGAARQGGPMVISDVDLSDPRSTDGGLTTCVS